MSIPIYSLVAYSNTGKTTFLEKLLPELTARGLRVAVFKHDAHEFQVDREGKDSWRMTRAGAAVTVIASETHSAFMENRYVPPETLIARITDVDVILTEGYKHGPWKKIAMSRKANGKPLPLPPEACFAVVTDEEVEADVPVLGLEDAAGLAELICRDMGWSGPDDPKLL